MIYRSFDREVVYVQEPIPAILQGIPRLLFHWANLMAAPAQTGTAARSSCSHGFVLL